MDKSAIHPKHYISQLLLICALCTKLNAYKSIKALTCKITKLLKR